MFPHGASAKYPMHYFERVVGTPKGSEASFFQCRGIRDTAFLSCFGTTPGEHVEMSKAKVIFALGCHFGENVHVSHLKRYLKGLEGFKRLKAFLSTWTLEKAASECDIPAAQIKEVAELLAANAPNVSIHPGRHVSWHGNCPGTLGARRG